MATLDLPAIRCPRMDCLNGERMFRAAKRPDAVLLINRDSVPLGSDHGVGKAMSSGKRTVMNPMTLITELSLILTFVNLDKYLTQYVLKTKYCHYILYLK